MNVTSIRNSLKAAVLATDIPDNEVVETEELRTLREEQATATADRQCQENVIATHREDLARIRLRLDEIWREERETIGAASSRLDEFQRERDQLVLDLGKLCEAEHDADEEIFNLNSTINDIEVMIAERLEPAKVAIALRRIAMTRVAECEAAE